MDWSQKELERFFNLNLCQLDYEWIEEKSFCFAYIGKALKYQLIIRPELQTVAISGDTNTPFGGDSLYEIYVDCDLIKIIPDPYYKNQSALSFWNGSPNNRKNLRLTIMKRPDGDLKVWPS